MDFVKFVWLPTLVYEPNVKCTATKIPRAARELFVALCCFSIVHWLRKYLKCLFDEVDLIAFRYLDRISSPQTTVFRIAVRESRASHCTLLRTDVRHGDYINVFNTNEMSRKYAFWHCCMCFLADVTGYPHRNTYHPEYVSHIAHLSV